ncbi:hypothetical protein FFLO_03093 [Filobasidium floriforme]|uniref:Uncharacterized protein n=1 Tax=Filobasidium floriforme TaxID=5210 RepID=A0A8K0NNK3_9TREE|nr:uncharacterized protein HD553DRAFT_325035 [Filobasidium floriforme]KAG7549057.1 hypothetical protein FFLO_03093 [Filobasidium floriforme]KAH8082175.1 hypothetical protein HD553DRAFT_325035 [Filobasidium floriforme]
MINDQTSSGEETVSTFKLSLLGRILFGKDGRQTYCFKPLVDPANQYYFADLFKTSDFEIVNDYVRDNNGETQGFPSGLTTMLHDRYSHKEVVHVETISSAFADREQQDDMPGWVYTRIKSNREKNLWRLHNERRRCGNRYEKFDQYPYHISTCDAKDWLRNGSLPHERFDWVSHDASCASPAATRISARADDTDIATSGLCSIRSYFSRGRIKLGSKQLPVSDDFHVDHAVR